MLPTLSQIIQQISRRDLTAEQLVSASINSIKAINPSVNAFSDTYFEEALETARDCDRDAKKNRWRGPLHGIPVGVKDLFLTKGRRTSRGSVAFQDFVPSESAPIVERIEAAGAITIGKTTTRSEEHTSELQSH